MRDDEHGTSKNHHIYCCVQSLSRELFIITPHRPRHQRREKRRTPHFGDDAAPAPPFSPPHKPWKTNIMLEKRSKHIDRTYLFSRAFWCSSLSVVVLNGNKSNKCVYNPRVAWTNGHKKCVHTRKKKTNPHTYRRTKKIETKTTLASKYRVSDARIIPTPPPLPSPPNFPTRHTAARPRRKTRKGSKGGKPLVIDETTRETIPSESAVCVLSIPPSPQAPPPTLVPPLDHLKTLRH